MGVTGPDRASDPRRPDGDPRLPDGAPRRPDGAPEQEVADRLDEEEIESFPASDPHSDWAGPPE